MSNPQESNRELILKALKDKHKRIMEMEVPTFVPPETVESVNVAYKQLTTLLEQDIANDGNLFAAIVDVGIFYLLLQPAGVAGFEMRNGADNLVASGIVPDRAKGKKKTITVEGEAFIVPGNDTIN